jgi:TPP-dependent pyruvate/acetoin dehydrogenase alpha subunit
MFDNEALYKTLYKIRRFEETILEQFSTGIFSGTTHTYIGQEANAVGIISHLSAGDIVFSNHRCHGHFLAYGGSMPALFAELMGKPSGVNAGRGGSQHIHWKNFYSNGIQGSIAPIATGTALAEKYQNTDAITVVFLGDGTLGQGVLYESLNLGSLWGAPILYVVENNQIAQTTPVELGVSGDIPARFEAFGIPTQAIDSSDVTEIALTAERLIKEIRKTQSPRALIINTHRFGPHSKGDDTREKEQVALLRKTRDPLNIHGERLEKGTRETIESEIDSAVITAFTDAKNAPAYEQGALV